MKSTKLKISLIALVFLITNFVTGVIVYHLKENEYNKLKDMIQTTITQKLEVQDELEAYKLACPDVSIEE